MSNRHLLVARPDEVAVYQLSDPARPRALRPLPYSGVRTLARPVLPNPTNAAYLSDDDGFGVVVRCDARAHGEVATYAGTPWFVGVSHQGSLLARHIAEDGVVEVYRALESARSSVARPQGRGSDDPGKCDG